MSAVSTVDGVRISVFCTLLGDRAAIHDGFALDFHYSRLREAGPLNLFGAASKPPLLLSAGQGETEQV